MTTNLIVAEGKDDLAALREILKRCLGGAIRKEKGGGRFEPQYPPGNLPPHDRVVWSSGDVVAAETHLLAALGRDVLGKRVAEQVKTQRADAPPLNLVGISFDPNGWTSEQCVAWAEGELRKQGLVLTSAAEGFAVAPPCGIAIVLLPWDLGTSFDELDAKLRNLERVALEILRQTDPAEAQLVDQFLAVLREKKKPISWKTAFRLWAAFRYADRDPGSGAMDQVFGQDKCVHAALDAVLKDTPFLRRLALFAGTSVSATPAKA